MTVQATIILYSFAVLVAIERLALLRAADAPIAATIVPPRCFPSPNKTWNVTLDDDVTMAKLVDGKRHDVTLIHQFTDGARWPELVEARWTNDSALALIFVRWATKSGALYLADTRQVPKPTVSPIPWRLFLDEVDRHLPRGSTSAAKEIDDITTVAKEHSIEVVATISLNDHENNEGFRSVVVRISNIGGGLKPEALYTSDQFKVADQAKAAAVAWLKRNSGEDQ